MSHILNLKDKKNQKHSNLSLLFTLSEISSHVVDQKLRRKVKKNASIFIPQLGGGGHSQKYWAGVGGSLPKALTLFKTKLCDFHYPRYDLTIKSITCFRKGRMTKKQLLKKKNEVKIRVQKSTPFRHPIYHQNGGKMAKTDTLFMTKTAGKPYPLGPYIPIYAISGSAPLARFSHHTER